MHEKQMHDFSVFLTLTYADEWLPPNGSLVKRDLQLFMKRLRKKFGEGIRFYACGEYGELLGRPHYHVLLFGHRFPDQKYYKKAKGGQDLFTSKICEELWPKGQNFIGEVTFDSCAYVARYILKKVSGELAEEHYRGREPEFTVMSRRPGIAANWFQKYHQGVYNWDSVITNGVEAKPPRFYDTRYEVVDPAGMKRVRLDRRRKALLSVDNTAARLYVRENVQRRKSALFQKRSLE